MDEDTCGACGTTLGPYEPTGVLGPNATGLAICPACGARNHAIYDAPNRPARDAIVVKGKER
jgi:hypothetical protein